MTRLDVAVYGLINAGKSSLINALAGTSARPTGPIGGTTLDVASRRNFCTAGRRTSTRWASAN